MTLKGLLDREHNLSRIGFIPSHVDERADGGRDAQAVDVRDFVWLKLASRDMEPGARRDGYWLEPPLFVRDP